MLEYLKQLSDQINSASENNKRKEKGILKRVFSAGNKNPLNEQELIVSLQKIEQQDRIAKEKMKERESQLAGISSKIKNKFYDLITKMENFADNLFTKIDVTETKTIPINSKDAKLITYHPESSYKMIHESNNKIACIEIKDPEQFWKISKYAVVELIK